MATHFAVLPVDIIHALSATLERKIPASVSEAGLSFLRLPHPRTGIPCLFLPSHESISGKGKILEVQAVSPPDSRSWFLGEEVFSDGKLLIVTPIDPTFLLLPILQAVQPTDGSAGRFRQADDIFEEAAVKLRTPGNPDDVSALDKDIIRFGSLQCTKDTLKNICDVKEVTPEITVFRMSQTRVLDYLRSKATRLSAPEALEVSRSTIRDLAKDGLMEDGKEALLQIGRLRAACDLLGQYLSPELRGLLIKSYDFTALDAHLNAIMDEAAAAAGTAANTKGGKKAKSQPAAVEDKKRKPAKGSHGVEKLKKANVNGMAKLSTFFKKKE
ncbi:Ribonuclease H2 subunit B [Termitomyces sp. T112]|nr:Ribonuclease H2 subunit B [Termitomyces sp. T112]KAH0588918.1 hypothetical protein H2248_004703 [Termitomyces sp. 'cryptogamus']